MTRLITIFIMLSGVVLGQTYNVAITNEVIVGAVTVTALVEIAEGAVTVNSTSTVDASISSGAFSGSTFTINQSTTITGVAGVVTVPTNAYAPPTTNDGIVTVFIPTNSGGGSPLSVYDGTTNSWGAVTSMQFSAGFSIEGVTNGAILVDYIGVPFPDWALGTNSLSVSGIGTQLVTFPLGVTAASVELWGGAGGYIYGAGAYGVMNLVGDLWNVQVMLIIPQGGQFFNLNNSANYSTGVAYQTDSAFPGGGRGFAYSTTNTASPVASGSGGYAAAYIIANGYTQLVMIVAGGAGMGRFASTSVTSGNGGSDVAGQDGAATSGQGLGGYGATSSSNGYYATLNNMLLTNVPPSQYQGGSAGMTNAYPSQASGGGGSPGYYSGSANYVTSTNVSAATGGGSGVSKVFTNEYVAFAAVYSTPATTQIPPATSRPTYSSGWGVPAQTTPPSYPASSRGGQGGGGVRY